MAETVQRHMTKNPSDPEAALHGAFSEVDTAFTESKFLSEGQKVRIL